MEEKLGITLVGLGLGTLDSITIKAWDWIKNQSELYLRTPILPFINSLPEYITVKYLINENTEIKIKDDDICNFIEEIIKLGQREQGVTFAVPGNPGIGDIYSERIIERAKEVDIPVHIIGGISYIDLIYPLLQLENTRQIILVDALELTQYYYPPFPPSAHIVIAQWMKTTSEMIKNILLHQYPADHVVKLIHEAGSSTQYIEETSLENVDIVNIGFSLTVLYIPPLSADSSFESFQNVIAHLRAPNGCPWDRKQTHQSLRTNLLEETYEALEALDAENYSSIVEELGDLILQIVLHSQIASESGVFRMADILQGIHRKLVRRHPHVFGEIEISGIDGVLKTWEALKAEERRENGVDEEKGILDGVPQIFPALSQAQEYQERARRVGFDWDTIEGVWQKIHEELLEVQSAKDEDSQTAEIGDLLFAVVNLARWMRVDAESSLRMTNQRFRSRFKYVEKAVKNSGCKWEDFTLDQLDIFWEEAKAFE